MSARYAYKRLAVTAALLLTLILMMAVSGCGGNDKTTTAATGTQKKTTGTGQEATAAGTPAGTTGGRTVYIDQFICPFTEEGQALNPGMVTAFLLVKVENTSGSDLITGPDGFTLESESGESYNAATGYNAANAIEAGTTIAPGETLTGVLFFDIPDDIKVVNLVDNSSPPPLKVPLPRPTGR